MTIRQRFIFSFQRESAWPLGLRFIICMLCFALLLSGVIFGSATLLRRVSVVNERTKNMLDTHLDIYEQDIANYFDHLAALGIRLSRDLTAAIETGGYKPETINGNPDAIVKMEQDLYDTLYRALQLANCSGAYFLLDATANLDIPEAETSKCGLYIKIANLSARAPVDMKILLYRGSTALSNHRVIEFHNKWALEFNSNLFPDYDLLINRAERNLNRCYLYTRALNLPGTWETVMLFCVPIVGEDGTVYGICGFEVSAIFFKLHHALSGAESHMAGLLAPEVNGEILADFGLQNGNRTNYYADLSGALSVEQTKYFDLFTLADGRQFAGAKMPVSLSPLSGDFVLSVMIPKPDYDAERLIETRENIVILLLLVISAVCGCIVLSRFFVSPILSGLDRIQSGELGKTNIKEIDSVLDYIGRLIEERKKIEQEAEQNQKTIKQLKAEKKAAPLPASAPAPAQTGTAAENLEANSLEKLNYQELRIADFILRGFSYTEIATVLKIKPNTVKWYQKELYSKLGINSKRELFALAAKK